MGSIAEKLGYVWFYLVMKTTALLPDLVPCMKFRGLLVAPVMGSCGRNFQLCSGAIILSPGRVSVGNDVYIGYGTWIQGAGGVTFGNEVMLGPYVIVASSNHSKIGRSFRFGPPQMSEISLGDGSWVGAHGVVTAGVAIGEGAVVAANSVVTRNVEPDDLVGGCPAKSLRRVDGPA
jgi:acetyltransferase-like isoleucine patch superfamily enzyme